MNQHLISLFSFILVFTCIACTGNAKKQSSHDASTEKVQSIVTSTKAQSGNDTAMLLVTFGSTRKTSHETYKKIEKQFEQAFPGMDIYLSFTSSICITRCAAGTNTEPVKFYAPSYWLKGIGLAGYSTICIQSLHCIPGEEYAKIRNTFVSDFLNDTELSESYRDNVKVYLGGPLLETEEDIDDLALALNSHLEQYAQEGAVAFIGHGNTKSADYGNANERYTRLEEKLQEINPHYFVGTVDMEGNLIENVIERMQEKNIKNGNVTLHPLLSIVGDHAENDMMGGKKEEAEEGSWRSEIKNSGYSCSIDHCILKGLADYPDIVDIWVHHAKIALKSTPIQRDKTE